MSFVLTGEGWRNIGENESALGVILLVVEAIRPYYFSVLDLDVPDEDGDDLKFVGAILNDPVHRESVNVFTRGEPPVVEFQFEIMADHFPLTDLRRAGVILQDITCRVYWYVAGTGLNLNDAFELLEGNLVEPSYDEERGVVHFRVEDARLQNEKVTPFPPIISEKRLFTGAEILLDSGTGKPYPIVIGSVKQSPVLLSDPGGYHKGVMAYDPFSEFSAADAPDAIYEDDEDVKAAKYNSTGVTTDGDGNRYLYFRLNAATTFDSQDVTVDFTGHSETGVTEVIKYLLRFFSGNPDIFDDATIDAMTKYFSAVDLAMVINSRSEGGVLKIVLERLGKQLPFAMLQRGRKFEFHPIRWDLEAAKVLTFDRNIIRRVYGPTETKRDEIYNVFTVRYAQSGLRGDFTECITRDGTTNEDCAISETRYGRRAMPDFDLPDVANDEGAQFVINWLVETFSKMRVFVGYECTLDVVDITLLDVVRVYDSYEGWDHGPFFKVIGIDRGTGPNINLHLVSIEDFVDVYGIVA
jgi:hypothetical protein